MIKTLLMILDPVATWERVVAAQRKWGTVLLGYLLPLLLLSAIVEGFGLTRWGRQLGEIPHVRTLTVAETVFFETAQVLLSFAVVLVGAKLIKSLGETFHGRHTMNQSFTVAAYGLGPVFLLRMLNAFPEMPVWVSWAIGIVLAAAVLYHGLPRVMQPDPPHAFGLYLMSILLLTLVSGLARFLTDWYLQGRFPKLNAIISHLPLH